MSESPGNPANERSNAAPDHSGQIAASIVCVECFYDLRSQPMDAACPECGRPIADSLNHPGGALVLADPKWLRQVWLGAAGMFLTGLLTAANSMLWGYSYNAALGIAFLTNLVQLVALLLMTSYEPAAKDAERREMPRETTRWFGVAGIMAGFVQIMLIVLVLQNSAFYFAYSMVPLVGGCNGFLGILTMVAFAFFVRSLLGRTTRNLAWPLALLPAIAVSFSFVLGYILPNDQQIGRTLGWAAYLAYVFVSLGLYGYFAWRIRAVAHAAASIR